MREETIENYLKNIYHLSVKKNAVVGTFELAGRLGVKPASVTEALGKLHELKYIVYEKSYGSRLTGAGSRLALAIIRRHRIWETYLVKELGFGWEEVHQIAEELEHVRNDKLINKLAEILGDPVFDPHGDPIPDKRLKVRKTDFLSLANGMAGKKYVVRGVLDHSTEFLKYLDKLHLAIGVVVKIDAIEPYDGSMQIVSGNRQIQLTQKAAEHLIVEPAG